MRRDACPRAWIALLIVGGLAACRKADDVSRVTASATQAPGKPARENAGDFAARMKGRCVVAEGYRAGEKIGPVLVSGSFEIGVVLAAGDDAWWKLPGGARVRVQGIVAERRDLPVFVQRPGEPVAQGIPVPEGTDIEAARRRFVIDRATVTLLRTVPEVETALLAKIGSDVSLDGVVWSLNGHWWFEHDGVEIHVDGEDRIPGFRALHGKPTTLHGRLERRAMPRIDQITLKKDRDLADAFVLQLRAMSPHPEWPVAACPKKE